MQITEIHTAGFESYIYIAFVVVGWIISMIRKMNKKNPQKPSNPYQPTTSQPTQESAFPEEFKDVFDELFQEREKETVSEPVVLKEEKTLREQRLEREKQEAAAVNQQFAQYSGTMDETKSIMEQHGGTPNSQKRFEHYRIKKTTKGSKYRKLISTKSDVKRAIIGAEILNRRF